MLTDNLVYTLGIFRPKEDFEPKFSSYCPHLMFKVDGVHAYINDSLVSLCHLLETVYDNCPFVFVYKDIGIKFPSDDITPQNTDISLGYVTLPLRIAKDDYHIYDRIIRDNIFSTDYCYILYSAQDYIRHHFKDIEDRNILDAAFKNMADVTFTHTIPQTVFNRKVHMLMTKDARHSE